MSTEPQLEKITFDAFEVDLRSEELWRGTRKVRCQRQPFRVLVALLEQAGQVVSREELQLTIWGSDSPADADHSLGIAVNKLREALSDSAETPRFIETLSRRGYRFIAEASLTYSASEGSEATPTAGLTVLDPVEPRAEAGDLHTSDELAPAVLQIEGVAIAPLDAARSGQGTGRHLPIVLVAGLFLALCAGGAIAWLLIANAGGGAPLRIDQVTFNDSIFPGVLAMESYPVLASDGSRLYSATLENGETHIASIDPQTGTMQPLQLPGEIVNPTLTDISPDGSRLLVLSHASTAAEQPLWVVPRGGGSGLRVGNVLAHDAIWMPDGQSVLFGAGDTLQVLRLDTNLVTPFATLPGRPFRMRWSPDGHLLRMTVLDPLAHTSSLWQLTTGHTPMPMLPGWNNPAQECCGVWSPDGKRYVFASAQAGGTDLWRMPAFRIDKPVRLTNGPLRFTAPLSGREDGSLYFVGLDMRSILQRYDAPAGRFVVERSFLADATRVSYSRDRQWVAWTDITGHLWRARAGTDMAGREKLQLTSDPLQVFLAQWSPDDRRLVMMAREPGGAWQLYAMNADGGVPVQLLHEHRNEADPGWSPDGQQIVFGRTPDLMGDEVGLKQLQLLDLRTHAVTPVLGSNGFFSPRWSPDGRWIAALTLGDQKLVLFDTRTRQWSLLGSTQQAAQPGAPGRHAASLPNSGIRAADPVWSADSRALYIHAAFSSPQTIVRVSVPDGSATVVAPIANPLVSDEADSVFVGMNRDEQPLIRVRTATGNLYSMKMGR
jgi:Tol biopolymer transport system component/DNA-binding winged helix-turn-helix (wHTH) protein